MNHKPKLRCAIYTRKSNEEGLDQEFNSLDAQRDFGEKYIASMRGEGWVMMPERYDDGGFTGGNTSRPALQKLLTDIKAGLIDVVVVYKIDRLSRSLLDFLQMVRMFDEYNVFFVSITQQINTSTSAGRLMINILMSFAEYEREVTGERIRDKIAASKKKGMWMGGVPPMGYHAKDRKLTVIEKEAAIVRDIFASFLRHESMTTVVAQMQRKGVKGKSWTSRRGVKHDGVPLNKNHIYRTLNNPLYVGMISHKGTLYPGEHEPIISQKTWDNTQAILKGKPGIKRTRQARNGTVYLLRGLLFESSGYALTPAWSQKRKDSKRYCYYTSVKAIKSSYRDAEIATVPAEQIEAIVLTQTRQLLTTPELVFKTYQQARAQAIGISMEDVRSSFADFNRLWEQLFPVERNRLLRLLIARIVVSPEGVHITYHNNGLVRLCQEMKLHTEAA